MKAQSPNKGFAIMGLNDFDWAFGQGSTLVLRFKFSAKTHHHRKARKRYPINRIDKSRALTSLVYESIEI